MPSRQVHEHLDELLLGKKYTWVHKWMDASWKTLGRKHRQVRHNFPGTPPTVYLMSGGDKGAAAAAALHIMLDEGRLSPDFVEMLHKVYGPREKQANPKRSDPLKVRLPKASEVPKRRYLSGQEIAAIIKFYAEKKSMPVKKFRKIMPFL